MKGHGLGHLKPLHITSRDEDFLDRELARVLRVSKIASGQAISFEIHLRFVTNEHRVSSSLSGLPIFRFEFVGEPRPARYDEQSAQVPTNLFFMIS